MTDTQERVIKTIRAHYERDNEPKAVEPATVLADDLEFDSLDNVELIMALEAEFDVEITDDEAENWTTVQHHVDGIEALLSRKAA